MGRYDSLIASETGLVAWWRLGEATGTTATDQQGSSTGTYAGTYTLGVAGALTDHLNTAVTLNGVTGSHVTIAAGTPLNRGAGPFSYELWAKRADALTGYQILYSKGNQGNLYFQNNQLVFDNGASEIARSVPTITDSLWHHIVVTHAGTGAGNTKIYVDGAVVSITEPAPNAATSSSVGLTGALGEYWANGGGTLAFKGSLDEAAVYSVVLTPTQILNHYSVGIAAADTYTATLSDAARYGVTLTETLQGLVTISDSGALG